MSRGRGLRAAGMRRALLLVLATGCGVPSGDVYEVCTIDAALEPSTALPGETVAVSGGPFSAELVRDTKVEVGGVPAVVVSVERNDACAECDTCRDEAGCPPCGLCNGRLLTQDRRRECFGDPLAAPPLEGDCSRCEQSMAFEVPAGAPTGPTTVWIVTRDGSSDPIPFVVAGPAPTTGDTGAPVGGHTGETGGTSPTP